MKHVHFAIVLITISLMTVSCEQTPPNADATLPTRPSPSTSSLVTSTLAHQSKTANAALPAGVLYYQADIYPIPPTQWVGKDGLTRSSFEGAFSSLWRSAIDFSPDGTRALFHQISYNGLEITRSDIILLDVKTGMRTQLTNDPNRLNWFPRWWPGNANTILFMSTRPGLDAGMVIDAIGSLGMVNVDGSDYKIYEDISFAQTMPSPDGKTLLYSDFKSLRWFTLDGQTGAIDPAQYPKFNVVEPKTDSNMCQALSGQLGMGTWSPDGSVVAWALCANEITFIHIQDPSKTFTTTHSRPALPAPSLWLPAWSSDGQYIAQAISDPVIQLSNLSTTPSIGSALRILNANGTLAHQIDLASDVILSLYWRPGAHELLYTTTPVTATGMIPSVPPPPGSTPMPPRSPASQSKAFLFNADTHTLVEINLPSPIVVQGWVSVP